MILNNQLETIFDYFNSLMKKKSYVIFSSLLFLYIIVFLLSKYTDYPAIKFLKICAGIFFTILGSGISTTLIIQWIFRRKFDAIEFITISFLGSLILFPLLLTAESALFKKAYSWYPLANTLATWLISFIPVLQNKTSIPDMPVIRKIFRDPLFVSFTMGLIFITAAIFSYRALPDLDPYKWLYKYSYQFANSHLNYAERPFFGSLTYIGTNFTGLGIFEFFKYILPYFFLVIFFPAAMIARLFPEKKKQWIFIFFSFCGPATLLYAQTAMPQAPLIIISYFFIFFLIYATEKKDDFFLYSSGITMLLAFFYHQLAIIAFIAWIIPVIIVKRKVFFSDKKTFFLIALLLATNYKLFENIYKFAYSWIFNIVNRIFIGNVINPFYPARYTNVDLNSMGWNSTSGVIKFYAFHAGPLVLLVLLGFVLSLCTNKKFRLFFADKLKNELPIIIAIFSFAAFFSIAEIFPRFPNIALLPDRAWIFAGIFTFIFVYLLLKFFPIPSRKTITVFSACLILGISGALYINYLKRYLITSSQWKSIEWIEKNLPEKRIFLSYGYKNLLPVHAETPLIRIPAKTYCSKNIEDFNEVLNNYDITFGNNLFLEKHYKPSIEAIQRMAGKALDYQKENHPDKYSNAVNMLNALSENISEISQSRKRRSQNATIIYPPSNQAFLSSPILIENIYSHYSAPSLTENPLYIYYSRQHKKNPYAGRPYSMQTWGITPCPDGIFLFDLYPEKFKRVYSTKDQEVIIWKVLRK